LSLSAAPRLTWTRSRGTDSPVGWALRID
jgi:hypothetical protein